jgi:hypothetical protein
MQYPEVTREELENLLLKIQQDIMNKTDDEDDEDDMSGAGDEAVESTIREIRQYFGLKEYPFTGKAWWEKPSTKILNRVENSGELENCLR